MPKDTIEKLREDYLKRTLDRKDISGEEIPKWLLDAIYDEADWFTSRFIALIEEERKRWEQEQRNKRLGLIPLHIPRELYNSIHAWIRNKYGKATDCTNPDCKGKSKTYEWALRKGFKYEKNVDNFVQLCRSCHCSMDATVEGQEKARQSRLGRGWTKFQLEKLVARRSKPVIQYSIDGNKINRFNSAAEAARAINGYATCISGCIRGKTKSAYGYVWKFEGEASTQH